MAVKRYNGTAWVTEAGGNPGLPSGMLAPFAGTTAPSGWELCYGQAVSRTAYANLFAVVGTTYGTGDGSTTFNLPDLRGRTPFGKDNMGGTTASRVTSSSGITGTTLGASGGNQLLQSHGHNFQSDAGAVAVGFTGLASSALRPSTANYTQTGSTTSSGGGSSENMPPAIILNYIIKV